MKVTRRCPGCHKFFEVSESRLKHGRGVHCSAACQYLTNRNKLSKPVLVACIGCGSTFETSPSRLNSKRGAGKYCTRACRDQHWLGHLNPNWQGGGHVNHRGPNWHRIRRAVVKRDGCCQGCGAVADSYHVHHKIPFRMFERHEDANDLDNLVALCPPCHRREDAKRKWVKVEPGCVLMLSAGGAAWQLAREKGMV